MRMYNSSPCVSTVFAFGTDAPVAQAGSHHGPAHCHVQGGTQGGHVRMNRFTVVTVVAVSRTISGIYRVPP